MSTDINITSGKIVVSDPCYYLEDAVIVNNVRNGVYECFITEDRHGQIARLIINHVSHSLYKGEPDMPYSSDACVDSGQMGIYDFEYFKSFENEAREYSDSDCMYGKVCHAIATEGFDTIDDRAAVSQSGYGDGRYEVFVEYDGDEIVTVGVTFVEDEDEYTDYDYCGEYYYRYDESDDEDEYDDTYNGDDEDEEYNDQAEDR